MTPASPPRPARSALGAVIVSSFVLGAATAAAQGDVPWTSARATVRPGEARIVAAHRAAPDAADGSFGARRRTARDRARERACAAIHGLVDELLARASVTPPEVEALHDAVDAHCEVIGVRPTVDGGAVVQVAVTFAALRAAADPEGAPW